MRRPRLRKEIKFNVVRFHGSEFLDESVNIFRPANVQPEVMRIVGAFGEPGMPSFSAYRVVDQSMHTVGPPWDRFHGLSPAGNLSLPGRPEQQEASQANKG